MNEHEHLKPGDVCLIEAACCIPARAQYANLEVTIVQRHEPVFICGYCGDSATDAFIVRPATASDVRAVPTKFLRRREPS